MNEIPDLLERFRRGAELVAVAITGAAGQEVDFKPAPEKWSVRQIVSHLADTETVMSVRFRQIIAEENPSLIAWNQNAWGDRVDSYRKPSQSLDLMRQLRSDNYELLKSLPPETFSRAGAHQERGTMSLLDLLRISAEHAEKHATQIRNVREAYKASRAKAAQSA